MLLTRFWIVLISLLHGAAVFVLYLAVSMYNRSSTRIMAERLSSDSQVVSWYLKDDARQRAAQLIPFAVNQELAKALQKSSESEGKIPAASQEKVLASLRAANTKIPEDMSFDAVFAVDQHGRVVAQLGYQQALGMDDFELGGYPVVADALHGYIRDDTLVLDRVYRVVARPVEIEIGQPPAGAVIGARIVDDKFARELSNRTSAAIGFFARGQRVASGAPADFDKSQLDQIVGDLEELSKDEAFREKGRSNMRLIDGLLGVQYSRLPGEAWALGAGYAVARLPDQVKSPLGFFQKSDDKDKKQANWIIAAALSFAAIALGLLFSIIEHTRPLQAFRREALRLAKGELDQLHPSKFRGIYRRIASDINDGIDMVAAKGGVPRKAADLKQVLGDIPDQPQMSAFAFAGDPAAPASSAGAGPASAVSSPQASRPLPSAPRSLPRPPGAGKPPGPAPRRTDDGATADPVAAKAAEWQQVYEEFVAAKQQCGEDVENFTFEKFEVTLKKNESAIVQRHGASRVKFSVYVKDGKAALKASPIREN
ncbi:MAG TPA: MXAN_5187 family protein [Polyangiaceae bacterium]